MINLQRDGNDIIMTQQVFYDIHKVSTMAGWNDFESDILTRHPKGEQNWLPEAPIFASKYRNKNATSENIQPNCG